jgi:hypothetical protein
MGTKTDIKALKDALKKRTAAPERYHRFSRVGCGAGVINPHPESALPMKRIGRNVAT